MGELLSSHNITGFLALFTDDCVYEDVTFGITNHGNGELRSFIQDVFAAFRDFQIDLS